MADLFSLVVFLIPIYIANAVPVVLGGGLPLDLNKKFIDGERIFGESKTLRGFIAGVSCGTVAAGLISFVYVLPFFPDATTQFIAGFVMSLGTMIGDAFGSFIKRRVKVSPGKPFILDSIMFIVVSLILVHPFATGPGPLYEIFNIAFIIILTVILHPLSNFIANQSGLKKVPW